MNTKGQSYFEIIQSCYCILKQSITNMPLFVNPKTVKIPLHIQPFKLILKKSTMIYLQANFLILKSKTMIPSPIVDFWKSMVCASGKNYEHCIQIE